MERRAKLHGSGEYAMNPVDCKERAAEYRRMAGDAPNSRVRGILTDMARTWDRLAIEAEIGHNSGPQVRAISEPVATHTPPDRR
jgi:hypothetical protein